MSFFDKVVNRTINRVENQVANSISNSISRGVDNTIRNTGKNIKTTVKNATSNEWKCNSCNSINPNSAAFCMNCGSQKGKDTIVFKCDKCGYVHTDTSVNPKFCPKCGDVVIQQPTT